jgi:hypothetical protein
MIRALKLRALRRVRRVVQRLDAALWDAENELRLREIELRRARHRDVVVTHAGPTIHA